MSLKMFKYEQDLEHGRKCHDKFSVRFVERFKMTMSWYVLRFVRKNSLFCCKNEIFFYRLIVNISQHSWRLLNLYQAPNISPPFYSGSDEVRGF